MAAHVSLVDLLPTFLEVGGCAVAPVDRLDGRSLLPLLSGAEPGADRTVIAEYSSEGVCAPSRMVRDGVHKYILTRGLPPMLFDLAADPELHAWHIELHDRVPGLPAWPLRAAGWSAVMTATC